MGKKLTEKAIEKLPLPPPGKKKARHRDHSLPGLEVVVTESGLRTWYHRYPAPSGKPRELKLGDARIMLPEQAHKQWHRNWALLHEGRDPKDERDAKRSARKRAVAAGGRSHTFSSVAREFVRSRAASWNKNEAPQWESELTRFIDPIMGWSSAEVDGWIAARLAARDTEAA